MAERRTRSERARANPPASTALRIVVVGASAGGFGALTALAEQLPAGFPAAVLVVLHIGADFPAGDFVARLDRRSKLHWKLAQDGERFRAGTAYVAPPDLHMLVKEHTILVTTCRRARSRTCASITARRRIRDRAERDIRRICEILGAARCPRAAASTVALCPARDAT